MLCKSNSVDETINIGEQFARGIKNNCGILLYGEPGAGKTHFVKGLARGLGINVQVTSPTFSIVNEYEDRLFHFDLFRITNFDDLYAIGFFDYIERGIIVCEWSENIPGLENEFADYYKISLTKTGENERDINIAHSGT